MARSRLERQPSAASNTSDSAASVPLDNLPPRYTSENSSASIQAAAQSQNTPQYSFSSHPQPPPAYIHEEDDLEIADDQTMLSPSEFVTEHYRNVQQRRTSPYTRVRPATPHPNLSARPDTANTANTFDMLRRSYQPTQPTDPPQALRHVPIGPIAYSVLFLEALVAIYAFASAIEPSQWACRRPWAAVALVFIGAWAWLYCFGLVMKMVMHLRPQWFREPARIDSILDMSTPVIAAIVGGVLAEVMTKKCAAC